MIIAAVREAGRDQKKGSEGSQRKREEWRVEVNRGEGREGEGKRQPKEKPYL